VGHVEDESDALGDLDIETFPTLLVLQGDHRASSGRVAAPKLSMRCCARSMRG